MSKAVKGSENPLASNSRQQAGFAGPQAGKRAKKEGEVSVLDDILIEVDENDIDTFGDMSTLGNWLAMAAIVLIIVVLVGGMFSVSGVFPP